MSDRGRERSEVDRSGAICYLSGCRDEPTHRVKWSDGERWYGICSACVDEIPVWRGQVVEGLTPETITTHPVATDGGASDRYHYALFSGGHDSLVSTHKSMLAGYTDTVLHIDTGIGIPETREYVERVCDEKGWPLEVVSSDFDYEEIVREYGFPGPGVHIIMYSKLKERALRKVAGWHDEKPHFYTGVRRSESVRRFRNLTEREKEAEQWVWHAPILAHTQEDVDAWIESAGLPRSPVKQTFHHSGECLCGAFGNRTEELVLLEAHYPETAERIKELEAEIQDLRGTDDPRSFWAHGGMADGELRALLADYDDAQMMLCASCESGYSKATDGGNARDVDTDSSQEDSA